MVKSESAPASAKDLPEGKSPTLHVPRCSWHSPDCTSFTKPWLGHPTCKHSPSSPALPCALGGEQPPGHPTPHFPGFTCRCIEAEDMLPACSFPSLPRFPSSQRCHTVRQALG